jgi:hypothetical protein
MKIKDIVERNDTRGHADVSNTFDKYYYKDDDCVITYLKEVLGTILIIKGNLKYFAFVIQNPEIYFGGYGYNLTRIDVSKAISLIKDKGIVANNDLFNGL